MKIKKNERMRAAIPHQGKRTLSCQSRFFLPRGNKMSKQIRREVTENTEISSWNCACT